MTSFRIEFEWWRDAAGYDVVPAGPSKPGAAQTNPLFDALPASFLSADELSKRDRIVRRGGELVPYRPFEVDGLHRIFARLARTSEGLLDFIERFGPLSQDGLEKERGEDIVHALCHASAMRNILDLSFGDRAHYFSHFVNGLSWSRIDVALVFNPVTKRPQFRLTPPWLIHALWLELGQVLSSEATIRNCLHCGAWFEAGPGTGRREDAKFCSDAHRVAFNSRKRSKGAVHA